MTEYGLAFLDALQTLHTPWGEQVMIFFTRLGNAGAIWIVFTVLLLLRRCTRRLGICCALALFLSFLLCNLTLKPLIMRPRPFTFSEIELLISAPGGYSFPSGHAASSFAAATALASAGKRWAVAAFLLAALISFSRLYLYLHFPGDILAGALLGIGCGLLAKRLSARFQLNG